MVSDKATRRYGKFEDMRGQRVGVLVDSVQFNMIDMPDTAGVHLSGLLHAAGRRARRPHLGIVDPPSIVYQIKTKNIPA